MARNEEKAQALLNKWTTMKQEFVKGEKARRPFLSSDCNDLAEAEKWRRDVIKEITKKVSEIQNAGLGEHMIRDLNDRINKLLREKYHWQVRIKELGGADYNRLEPRTYDADGRALPGSGGYKYFGAARELPGVRELFQEQIPEAPRRTRGEMLRGITPDYFGFRDEEDGILLAKEAEVEKRKVEEAVKEFNLKRQKIQEEKKKQRLEEGKGTDTAVETESSDDDDIAEEIANLGPSATTSAALKALVPVPSQDLIREAILERKKKALLAKLDAEDAIDLEDEHAVEEAS